VENASFGIVASQKLRCYNGTMKTNTIETISDRQLLDELKSAASNERRVHSRMAV